MSKQFRFCHNLHTLKKNGSLIFCDICKKIVGSINSFSCNDLLISLRCTCGAFGYLQYSSSDEIEKDPVNSVPDYVRGVYVCHKCRTPLFSIINNRVENYTFYAVCSCGEVYDTRVNHDKRLSETLRILDIIKEKHI